MNIIVIGGTGQLGHFVLKHLSAKGHQTTAIGLGKLPEKGYLPEETTVISANINECGIDELVQLIAGSDVVVHAAGADGRDLFDAPAIDGFRRANVTPIRNLVAAMKLTGARRLIILGSYYTAMHRKFPALDIVGKSAYVRSRQEQAEAAFADAGDGIDVGILELPYIFGAAPNRGTLWGFYIKSIQEADGEIHVHSGGSACITMNQVGLATANACELVSGHQFYPIGNANLKYQEIYALFCKALQLERKIIPLGKSYFMDKALQQAEQLKKLGKESAYDPAGLLEMEAYDFFIDPHLSMEALHFGFEDMALAIKESVDATLQFEGKGPGAISVQ